ncbi:MAG: hypothetical protein KatS3mg004_3757 [Bryobacteraceae bacterium]|nr:MAG: hypothetical protein KatS3mg004_3757 [Bryobacteraceae bacterium]
MNLPRGLEMEPFDEPVFVVEMAEFLEHFGQLLQRVEAPRGQQLLLAGGAGG